MEPPSGGGVGEPLLEGLADESEDFDNSDDCEDPLSDAAADILALLDGELAGLNVSKLVAPHRLFGVIRDVLHSTEAGTVCTIVWEQQEAEGATPAEARRYAIEYLRFMPAACCGDVLGMKISPSAQMSAAEFLCCALNEDHASENPQYHPTLEEGGAGGERYPLGRAPITPSAESITVCIDGMQVYSFKDLPGAVKVLGHHCRYALRHWNDGLLC